MHSCICVSRYFVLHILENQLDEMNMRTKLQLRHSRIYRTELCLICNFTVFFAKPNSSNNNKNNDSGNKKKIIKDGKKEPYRATESIDRFLGRFERKSGHYISDWFTSTREPTDSDKRHSVRSEIILWHV